MAVGLFGGSFDPPHAGHVLVAETALARLRLDQLWWIVTPQNPLKSHRGRDDLARRVALCESIATDPRIRVTAFEAAHNIRYSADTIDLVLKRNRATRFVWMMGADNLKEFHRWERWRWIANAVPIAVFDRPGSTLAFLSSIMARAFAHARVDEDDAKVLARMSPPAWTFIHGPRSSLSSTAIRRGNEPARRGTE